MPNWTKAQLAAIMLRGQDLMVSAAAGSGKTAVLTERILSLLKEGENLSNMLVITFTNAAAAEMRERITNALAQIAGEDAHLRRQWQERDSAAISTIHAFCIRLLRRYFAVADVDVSFIVLDQAQTAQLWQEALDEAVDEIYLSVERQALLSRLGKVEQVSQMATDLHAFLENQPDPEKWKADALSLYQSAQENFSDSEIAAILRESQTETLHTALAILDKAQALLKTSDAPLQYLPALQEIMQAAQVLLQGKEPPAAFSRLSSSKKGDARLREQIKTLLTQARTLVKEAQEVLSPCLEGAQPFPFGELLPAIKALFSLVKEAQARFADKKKENGGLSFSDLEHKTLLLLQDEEVASLVRESWPYIFVDEYQDSNPVQEALLERLKTRGKLFLVGDVKQSIYRFRMAEPLLFVNRRSRYLKKEEEGSVIDLNRNFRSEKNILAFCNRLFLPLMQRPLSEVSYGEEEALYPVREEGSASVEIELLANFTQEIPEEAQQEGTLEEMEERLEPEMLSSTLRESQVIARKIRALKKEKIPDKDTGLLRSVEYGDIAILIRSPRTKIEALTQTLMEEGIPFYADTGGGLYDHYEMQVFLSLLWLCVNFENDFALLTVLRALCRLSAQALTALRLKKPGESLYQAALCYAQEEGEEAKRVQELLLNCKIWRKRAYELPLGAFLQELMLESRLWSLCAALPQGEKRQANLYALCAKAARYEGKFSLRQFLLLCEHLRRQGDSTDAQQIAPSQDVVRIMSVHKSKGLEFPIVIGAFLGSRLRLPNRSDWLFDDKLGLGLSLYQEENSLHRSNPLQKALLLRKKRQDLSEEMRILYVLCTRARDKLILIGSVNNLKRARDRWQEMQARKNGMEKAGSLLDFICASLFLMPQATLLREGQMLTKEEEAKIQEGLPLFSLEKNLPLDTNFTLHMQETLLPKEYPAPLSQADLTLYPVPPWLEKQLSFVYPYHSALTIVQKLSVTSLTQKNGLVPPQEVPSFLKETPVLTSARRGLALHTFMEQLSYERFLDLPEGKFAGELVKQKEEMVKRGLLEKTEADSVSLYRIEEFLHAPLGKLALQSPLLFRETPFNLSLTQTQDGSFVRAQGEEDISLLQGVIDLHFLIRHKGQEGWALVDYKTDRYGLSKEEVALNHGTQLHWYKEALETLTQKPVLRMSVYLFHIGEEVRFI